MAKTKIEKQVDNFLIGTVMIIAFVGFTIYFAKKYTGWFMLILGVITVTGILVAVWYQHYKTEAEKKYLKQLEMKRQEVENLLKVFYGKIKSLESKGYKVTYAKPETGTITYRDNDNITHTMSLYKGYNSHGK